MTGWRLEIISPRNPPPLLTALRLRWLWYTRRWRRVGTRASVSFPAGAGPTASHAPSTSRRTPWS